MPCSCSKMVALMISKAIKPLLSYNETTFIEILFYVFLYLLKVINTEFYGNFQI